jgi:hypothetical protein
MENLSIQDLTQFNAFLLKQIRLTQRKIICPLYRGDKLENLFTRLGSSYNEAKEPNYEQLLSRLFMVGEKSRNFYSDEFFQKDNRTIRIDDCDENVFNYIFDNINSSLKSKNTHTISFFDKNEKFKQFFSNKAANKQIFSSAILAAKESEQIYFKNYYLILLHQLGSINYRDSSHLVSTSMDYKVAQNFASGNYPSKSIVIHAWTTVNAYRDKFKKYRLPKYSGMPYKNQKEISVLAGILPHYIIGLEIIEDEIFFINPNIFINAITDNLFIDGLDIDQTDFDEVLKQTKYRKSFWVQGDKIREIT